MPVFYQAPWGVWCLCYWCLTPRDTLIIAPLVSTLCLFCWNIIIEYLSTWYFNVKIHKLFPGMEIGCRCVDRNNEAPMRERERELQRTSMACAPIYCTANTPYRWINNNNNSGSGANSSNSTSKSIILAIEIVGVNVRTSGFRVSVLCFRCFWMWCSIIGDYGAAITCTGSPSGRANFPQRSIFLHVNKINP